MQGLRKSVERYENTTRRVEVVMIEQGGNNPASTLWMYGKSAGRLA